MFRSWKLNWGTGAAVWGVAGAPEVGTTVGVVTVDMAGVGMVSVTREAMEPVLLAAGSGVLVLGGTLACWAAGMTLGSSIPFLTPDRFSLRCVRLV